MCAAFARELDEADPAARLSAAYEEAFGPAAAGDPWGAFAEIQRDLAADEAERRAREERLSADRQRGAAAWEAAARHRGAVPADQAPVFCAAWYRPEPPRVF